MSSKAPWRDEKMLRELYHEDGLGAVKIGERLGCSGRCVLNWMEEYGIERRPRGYNGSGPDSPVWVPYARFEITNGYEVWRDRGSDRATVLVHRLAAVAWFGWDAVIGNDVHHKNGMRRDNRESNLQPIDPVEHRRMHAIERNK